MLLLFDDPKTFCVTTDQMLTLSGLCVCVWGGILYCPTCLNPLLFPSFWKDSIFIYVYVCISLVCEHVPVSASQAQEEGIVTDDQTTQKVPGESAYQG